MKDIIVVDRFDCVTEKVVRDSFVKGNDVYVMEPFIAFHRRSADVPIYVKQFPEFIQRLLDEKIVRLLSAQRIDGRSIYGQAGDRAVEDLDAVYPQYRKRHEPIIDCLAGIIGPVRADKVFQKLLCEKLAEYYSLNIFLQRLSEQFKRVRIIVYPDAVMDQYEELDELVRAAGLKVFKDDRISVPSKLKSWKRKADLKEKLKLICFVGLQLAGSILVAPFKRDGPVNKKEHLLGVAIVSPWRQFRGKHGGADFMVDGKLIKPDDVVYFTGGKLAEEQSEKMRQMSGRCIQLPDAKFYFSHFRSWLKLAKLMLTKTLLRYPGEIKNTIIVLQQYYIWKHVLRGFKIRHFVSHCDFTTSHIGRNAALKGDNVETWYFTDSMNLGCNMRVGRNKDCEVRHPFWVNLDYDHFVTWTDNISQFIARHPGNTFKRHVVGCLWSQQIMEYLNSDMSVRARISEPFVIAAFDTTYSLNGYATYEEGVLFAEQLLSIINVNEDIRLIFKEKKGRRRHALLNPLNGWKLTEIYGRMAEHERITMLSADADVGEAIAAADIVISFPFTSTTFEAFSIGVPAVWHDPKGEYRDSPFAQEKGMTTHSLEELEVRIRGVRSGEIKGDPLNFSDNALLDPYHDGRAIERFRQLICNEEQIDKFSFAKKSRILIS